MQLRLLRGQPSPDELLERVPETEFTDVTRTIVRDGRVVAKIQAQRVLNFRRARTILLDMQYTEYDAAGNAVTTGSSERATYLHRALSGAELAGSIRLRSDSQEVRLAADTLVRFRIAVRHGETQAGAASAPFDDGRRDTAGVAVEHDSKASSFTADGGSQSARWGSRQVRGGPERAA